VLKFLAGLIFKLIGWQLKVTMPDTKKFVLIGAPHTTNWDLGIALLTFWSLPQRITWLAKKQIFIGPVSWLFKSLGGIPIDRSAAHGFIQQISERFDNSEQMILCLAPEGTRSKTVFWKTGFYYIALSARVPICLGYVDYPTRTVGFEEVLTPSGDIEKDFEKIKDFYKDKKGKHPEKQGPVAINPARIEAAKANAEKAAATNPGTSSTDTDR
jgi:1-acyl-sn-glycerol-3-phosphate acyltransferase